ncbi:hypothetical protein BVRB_008610 [Beta vulgaris subsp. vulgaris]|uniref:BHLH domain-containing protein n=1 Tax=Beta vulgaris subsp. vulgaris TaxID=3555 RepID=A0A0J8B684_BETVV|nr:hypothetical protein BVRB_008610 [Beta vulgaris subsp. vulgaris]
MVFTNNTSIINNPSSSSLQETDDISLFLRQILHRSSSSTSPTSQPFTAASSSVPSMRSHAVDQLLSYGTPTLLNHNNNNIPGSTPSAVFSGSDRLSVNRVSHDTLNGVVLPPFTLPTASNLSSESLSGSVQLRSFENNDFVEDNDCESEEGNEVVVGDMEMNQQLSRNQSKRSRAAEVHNLSEKRRRCRINEKMKALQNLIPNSNKTDKASMLDEAIEYLKQLQLQVQMLSMRNGLNLHPMCVPGGQGILHPSQLSQMGIDIDNGSGSYDINMTTALNTIPETSNTMLNLSNQSTSSLRPYLPVVPPTINSEAMSFDPESCVPANFSSFQLRNSPQVAGERSIHHERLVANNIDDAESLVPTTTRLGRNPVEERMQQKKGPEETFLENVSGQKQNQNQLIASKFSGLLAASSGAQMTS